MNQSKTKSQITLIALCLVALVFTLLVASVIEIRKCYVYRQRIASQERQIAELKNAKDYYNSQLQNKDDYTDGDLIFGEE